MTDAPVIAATALSAVDEVETPPSPAEPSPDDSAYETFAAFDVTWNDPSPAAPIPPDATASPLDVASLGSAAGNEEIWADDIAADAHVSSESDTNTPAWLMDDAPPVGLEPASAGMGETPAHQHISLEASDASETTSAPMEELALESSGRSPDGTWTEDAVIPSADTIVAGHSALDQVAEAHAVTPDVPAAGPWSDQLLAEYAPYIPTPALQLQAVDHEGSAAGPVAADDEAVEGPDETIATAPTEATLENNAMPAVIAEPVFADAAYGVRAAATLNRLADRIRDGEIDVSSIAPDASDAAVLASVLAALLRGGGGGSGRR